MRKLGYSDAQIEEMLEDDKAVDRGEPLPWDMDKAEHKKAMKYANADEHKKPIIVEDRPRPRKANLPKQDIINGLFAYLTEKCDFSPTNVVITNKEKTIFFEYEGETFEIDLKQKRKPKS